MKYLWIAFFVLFSCTDFPADPKNTLNDVTNGVLKVGYSENKPWVFKTQNGVEGIEAEMIKNFADSLHAKIEWINGTEEILFEMLEKNELDVVIAGLTNKTPWKSKKVGLTRPYRKEGKKKHVIAVEQGENRFQVALEKYMYSTQKHSGN